MQRILLLILLFIIPLFAKAQTDISGEWLMYQAVMAGDTTTPYFIMDFTADGHIKIYGIDLGKWDYNPDTRIINFDSKKDPDFNGKGEVLSISDSELTVKKDGMILYYKKIDHERIDRNNEKSHLTGVWKMKTAPNIFLYLKFSSPDNFLYVSNLDGALTRIRGNWICNTADSSVIIITLQRDFRGLSKIKFYSPTQLRIIKENGVFDFIKVNTNDAAIERLTFSEEDLENIDLNEEQNKLPWRDFELMVERLANISQLVFRNGTLLEDLNLLTYNTLISKIKIDNEKNTVSFSNKTVNGRDTMQYSENYKGGLSERYNDFFPNDSPVYFRVVGKDTVSVPAGQFVCTVVEAIDGEKKIKYWMVDDLPGIYAKTIIETKDVLGDLQYTVTELVEISR